jgi:hypothetical protein
VAKTYAGTLFKVSLKNPLEFTNREDEGSDFPFKIIKVDLDLFDDES